MPFPFVAMRATERRGRLASMAIPPNRLKSLITALLLFTIVMPTAIAYLPTPTKER